MSEIILDEGIESGEWPQEFSGAWVAAISDPITTDFICALYFDEINSESTVVEYQSIPPEIGIPDAYVSWKTDGECREIFVHPDYRRRGIGTKLCAWARSYAYNNQGLVFKAPPTMTASAQAMLQNVSNVYGEEYTDPESSPPTLPYGYWGGYLV